MLAAVGARHRLLSSIVTKREDGMRRLLGLVVGLLAGVAPAMAADLTGRFVGTGTAATTSIGMQETPAGVTGQLVGADIGTLTGTRNGWFVDGEVDLTGVGKYPIRLIDFGPWGLEMQLSGTNGKATLVFVRDDRPVQEVARSSHDYLLRDVETFGRVNREEVARLVAANRLDGNSLAWTDGLADWTPLRDMPDLAGLVPDAGARPDPEPVDPLEAMARQQINAQLGFYDQLIRDGITACVVGNFAPLSPADRQVLIDTQIDPQGDFLDRNPGFMESLHGCIDPATTPPGGVPRSSIEMLDGRIFAISGPEPHELDVIEGGATFTVAGSTFSLTGDTLLVNGAEAEIEPFSRSLEVQVSADGETATLLYDQ